jgi:hypothetical protein
MTFRYQVIENDPDRPWRILSIRTGLTLEADDAYAFRDKAQAQWPPDRYTVEMEPGELMKSLRST